MASWTTDLATLNSFGVYLRPRNRWVDAEMVNSAGNQILHCRGATFVGDMSGSDTGD
jgi:hypothetical protein